MIPRMTVLWRIRLLHTLVWAVFAGAILAIPIVTWLGRLRLALWLSGLCWSEVLVLLANRMRCPLTGIAAELERMGLPPVEIRSAVRTGDTPQAERAKWRKRATVEDMKTGPSEPRSTVLTEAEEAMIVAFRRHTLLPLDDCLYALQPTIPHLTRSALHRCLQRHGISRLPDMEGDKPKRSKFKRYPIGFFH